MTIQTNDNVYLARRIDALEERINNMLNGEELFLKIAIVNPIRFYKDYSSFLKRRIKRVEVKTDRVYPDTDTIPRFTTYDVVYRCSSCDNDSIIRDVESKSGRRHVSCGMCGKHLEIVWESTNAINTSKS